MKDLYSIVGNPPPAYPIFERIFNFIEDYLPDFKPLRKTKDGRLSKLEDDISEDLADFLDNRQELLNQDRNSSFRFTNQSRKKTDIGVKLGRGYHENNRVPICWIEAKRLPTPSGGKNRDEREYVIVSQVKKENGKRKYKGNGGIQRFKENKHAQELLYSIMIGYLQDDNTVDYWISKINKWIKDIDDGFWSSEDCLNKCLSDNCDKFISTHTRESNNPITLHHYWIRC